MKNNHSEVQNSMLQANSATASALFSFNFSKQITETTKPILAEINSATSYHFRTK